MKYYLIIGYQLLERYRTFPIVTVHMNGQFVDEFECDNQEATQMSAREIYINNIKGYGNARQCDRIEDFSFTTPSKYKMYELDSNDWPEQGELSIEVSKSYSNYTNGFMSRRSMVKFNPVFLIRKDLYDNHEAMMKIIKAQRYANWVNRSHNRDDEQNLQMKIVRPTWPGFSSYPDNFRKEAGDLYKGGNFTIKFAIKKKHKTYMLVGDDMNTKGYFQLDVFFLAWYNFYTKKPHELILRKEYDTDKQTQSIDIQLNPINTNNENQRDNHA
mgnify:CR=1 FL=1